MKKIKENIQVFLINDTSCEVSGELVYLNISESYIDVHYREEDGGDVWRSVFPMSQIRMIRRWPI